MRIAYIALSTPSSKASWSGIPWYSLQEIRRRFPDTHVIDTPRADHWVDKLSKFERYGIVCRRSRLVTGYYAHVVNAALERIRPDAIVAVSAAHKLAGIDRKWPIVYATDALFMTVMNYYEKYATLGPRFRAAGDRVQREFLQRADRVLMASDWGAKGASEHYGLTAPCLSVAPMGANLDVDPGYEPPRAGEPLTLLFVGYAWERKGGPLVFDIWRELRRRTGNARLHIVGGEPAEAKGVEGVTIHGMLDKSDPAQYRKFVDLYRKSHFFVMPSRQEAYGIVYCEAAAFGRPVVAAHTGAIETIVRDGETGLILSLDAGPEAYADRILDLWRDEARFAGVCAAARRRYDDVLNWRAWGDHVEAAIHELTDRAPGRMA